MSLSTGDDQVARPGQAGPVAVFRGHLDVDRDPGPVLDQVPADQPRVVRGAAGDQVDALDAGELAPGDPAVILAMGPGFSTELVLVEW